MFICSFRMLLVKRNEPCALRISICMSVYSTNSMNGFSQAKVIQWRLYQLRKEYKHWTKRESVTLKTANVRKDKCSEFEWERERMWMLLSHQNNLKIQAVKGFTFEIHMLNGLHWGFDNDFCSLVIHFQFPASRHNPRTQRQKFTFIPATILSICFIHGHLN